MSEKTLPTLCLTKKGKGKKKQNTATVKIFKKTTKKNKCCPDNECSQILGLCLAFRGAHIEWSIL